MAGVNPTLTGEIAEHLRALNAEGVTICLIEHDMKLIGHLCDPVIVMAEGRRLTQGRFEEVVADERVQEAYLGEGTDMLEAKGLIAGYGAAEEILKGATVEIQSGEIVTIIGPNGAGKSTLLKAIAGLVPLKGGTVTISGVDVSRQDALGRSKAGLAFVMQEKNVFGTMSVAENLEVASFPTRAEWPVAAMRSMRAIRCWPKSARRLPAHYRAGSGNCWPWAWA